MTVGNYKIYIINIHSKAPGLAKKTSKTVEKYIHNINKLSVYTIKTTASKEKLAY